MGAAASAGCGCARQLLGKTVPLFIQLYLAVGIAVVVSALCSIFEAVLYSVPQSHIEVLARDNKRSGRALKKLRKHIEKPITAILTLNTISQSPNYANISGEIELLKSRLFFSKVIEATDIDVSYFAIGNVRTDETGLADHHHP